MTDMLSRLSGEAGGPHLNCKTGVFFFSSGVSVGDAVAHSSTARGTAELGRAHFHTQPTSPGLLMFEIPFAPNGSVENASLKPFPFFFLFFFFCIIASRWPGCDSGIWHFVLRRPLEMLHPAIQAHGLNSGRHSHLHTRTQKREAHLERQRQG